MGMDELLFGGALGWNSGQKTGMHCYSCCQPQSCAEFGCAMQRQADQANLSNRMPGGFTDWQGRWRASDFTNFRPIDPGFIDLPPDAVREVRAVPALPAPLIDGDSDGGECD